jgi:hypothetical protein
MGCKSKTRFCFISPGAVAALVAAAAAIHVAAAMEGDAPIGPEGDGHAAPIAPQATNRPPSIEDYATIEGLCNGVPIYSFSNIMYVYGQGPDLRPGLVYQEGNRRPAVKIKLKKSWEIKSNYCGCEHEMTVRTPLNDAQPLLPIHLIDGDPKTVWSSWGCTVPDGRPEWIRIDLPAESQLASVTLLACKDFPQSDKTCYGKAFPKEVEIQVSRDAWHWETVYENKNVPVDDLKLDAAFKARPAKQVLIKANHFPKKCSSNSYVFSIGKVEVRDVAGNNLALVSRGAGVTVSSTSYEMMNDRYTQDALWGPLQYDLGNKWVRVGGDNGSFIWPFVEHEKGKLQIDKRADESLSECQRNGIRVILTLDFKGNWIYMNPPRKSNWREARFRELNDSYNDSTGSALDSKEMFAAYLKYIEYMVGRFQDRVEYFEIGNEWDLHMNADTYMREVFEPTYAAVKRVAPQAKVMLGSPACHDAALLRPCVSRPGVAAKIDAIGWHPQVGPNADYFAQVRRLQKDCRELGFQGRFFATEIYAGSISPAGEAQGWQAHCKMTEEAEANFLAQSLVGHAGLGMEAGPCHPNFTGWPHPQSLVRVAWPSQIITPCQPKMIYYMWRNAATIMDDFHPADFAVKINPPQNLLWFPFQRGDRQRMVALWVNNSWEAGSCQVKVDIALPAVTAKRAWAADIMNGAEQELDIAAQGADSVIRGVIVRNYPLFVKVQQ